MLCQAFCLLACSKFTDSWNQVVSSPQRSSPNHGLQSPDPNPPALEVDRHEVLHQIAPSLQCLSEVVGALFFPKNPVTWILKVDIPTRDARQPTWTQLWTAYSHRAGGDAFWVLILVMVTDICRGQHVSEHWCPGLGKEELCEHYLSLHCWVLLETEHTELNSR